MTSMEVWKLFEPDNYYRSFLEQSKRPDGRGLTEVRPISINVGTITTADGSATVRIGHTAVICGIKAELATPHLRKPNEGFVIPNVELYPCCSPKFKAGPPGEKAIAASQFLKNVIVSSNMLNLEDFCIKPNKLAWCLFCDVVCLNYDGNILDAALMSLMAALQNLRLPEVKYDDDTEKVEVCGKQKLPVNLMLIDPTAEDEDQGSGEVTIVLLEDGTVCTIHKSGGQLLAQETLERFIEMGKKQIDVVNDCIAKALTERMETS